MKKKHLRCLLVLLVAVCMVCSIAVPVCAEVLPSAQIGTPETALESDTEKDNTPTPTPTDTPTPEPAPSEAPSTPETSEPAATSETAAPARCQGAGLQRLERCSQILSGAAAYPGAVRAEPGADHGTGPRPGTDTVKPYIHNTEK